QFGTCLAHATVSLLFACASLEKTAKNPGMLVCSFSIPQVVVVLLCSFKRAPRSRTLVWREPPTRVWVISLHCLGQLSSLGPKIFLRHSALLVRDKGHHAGRAIVRRPCDERKTTDHIPVDYIIVFAPRRMLALALEDFEQVSMEGLGTGLGTGRIRKI